ncbi:MAG: tetratricopeptide repeat protein [Chloroflexota bacterium]|nr:tetratricopeptide repeat protein [Chloroflexota bacterium]
MSASRRFAVIGIICLAVLGLALPEDGVDGWVAAGDQAAARGGYTQALSLFEGAARRGLYGGGLPLRIGQVHLAKHRFDQAEKSLQQALSDCAAAEEAFAWTRLPASLCAPQASLALGELFRQTARPAEARDALLRSLAGGEGEAALPLALVYLRTGELDQARGLLTGLAARGDQQASLLLGLLLLATDPDAAHAPLTAASQGVDAEAAAAARQILPVLPSLAEEADPAYRALLAARAALRASEPQVAFADFGIALRANPLYAGALAYQGYALHLLGEPAAALATADRALALDPSSSQAHYVRGLALRAQGQPALAVAELEAALAADSGNPVILMDLGDTYALLRNYPQAQADLEAATRADSSSPIPWMRLAHFHLESLLSVESGLAAAQRAVALAPVNGEARDLLGWGLYLNRRVDDALVELRQAVALAPRSASAHYHLGVVAAQAGDKETARRVLQRAVDLDTTGDVEGRAAKALSDLR